MVIIYSSGRSGTNLSLEILTGHSYFEPSKQPEDKLLFKRDIVYPEKYLCKSDTVYCKSFTEFYSFMVKNRDAKIIWTIRQPYDWCLSKLYRGRPLEKRGWKPADDGTIEGCLEDIEHMSDILFNGLYHFKDRILIVKMEDVLRDITKATERMCKFIGIELEDSMLRPWERMRHQGKKERYGNKIHTSQIDLYKDIDKIYGGYFKETDLSELFEKMLPLCKFFKYKV